MQNYLPPAQILQKYAQVLVNYALHSGNGVRPGEVVQIIVPDVAKPLALALQNTVLQAGAHPIIRLLPTEFESDFYRLSNDEQRTFFPEALLRERVKLIDHSISIIADPNPTELSSTDPARIMQRRVAQKPYRDWLNKKESQGKFTWVGALWGTQAKAQMVNLTLEEYWQEIINACFLDYEDPVSEWRAFAKKQKALLKSLNALNITSLKITGDDVDLTIKIGQQRKWLGGSGRNIPSFEVFTSPDWRGTQGWIQFNQPLYRYGSVLTDIRLEFEDGIVTNASATRGENVLREMIAAPNANKVGEFSLTDARHSRISHVMAETLYDENIGGKFGNTHIALGMAYQDTYDGDPQKLSAADWERLGFNDSAIHTDIISTTNRTVTAQLEDGSELTLYQNGCFQLD